MDNKTTYVTQHHITVAVLLFCVMTLFVVLNAVAVPLAYANPYTDGKEDVSSKTVTGYYVTVPLSAVGQFRYDNPDVDMGYRRKWFTRSTVNITAIVIFRGIKTENGKSPFISTNIDLNMPMVGLGAKYWFEGDAAGQKINVRESYYWGLQAAFAGKTKIEVDIVLMNEGNAVGVYPVGGGKVFTLGELRFETTQLPPGVNDPDSPDFQWGDNGGSTTPSPDPEPAVPLFERIGMAFRAVLDGTATAADWAIAVITVILGLIALGFLLKLLTLVFGRGKST